MEQLTINQIRKQLKTMGFKVYTSSNSLGRYVEIAHAVERCILGNAIDHDQYAKMEGDINRLKLWFVKNRELIPYKTDDYKTFGYAGMMTY